ncbi:hypothetical protein [Paenibacillus tepidiphilus]|uniref:hypothetical protein n=1 Tax=Paenibacillus tepidiphilus TaxID=2608683 RepID=UPI00123B7A0C|nr:hypothetical protein [Paenibacillus tepidiphilus]
MKLGFPFRGSGDSGQHEQLQLALPVSPMKPGFPSALPALAADMSSCSLRSRCLRMKLGFPFRGSGDSGQHEQLQLALPVSPMKPGFPFGGSGNSGRHKQLQLALPASPDEAGLPVRRVRRQWPARAAAACAPGAPDEAGASRSAGPATVTSTSSCSLRSRCLRMKAGFLFRGSGYSGQDKQLQLAFPASPDEGGLSRSAGPVTVASTSSCSLRSRRLRMKVGFPVRRVRRQRPARTTAPRAPGFCTKSGSRSAGPATTVGTSNCSSHSRRSV